jgi:putative ABC transport system permease protein
VSSARFVWRLAVREMRGSIGRSLLLTASITAGVAALVAIQSFSEALQGSVRREARSLLGADLAVWSTQPFGAAVEAQLADMRERDKAEIARVTSFGAMALVPRSGSTRLVNVMAISGGWPFYGNLQTSPAGLWPRVSSPAPPDPAPALVDESLLPMLDAKVGDTLRIGEAHFVVMGTVHNLPGDVGLRSALGPRVFLPLARADATQLLKQGSRARYEAFLRIPPAVSPDPIALRHRALLVRERANIRTVDEEQRSVSSSLGRLASYLKLVALLALLLGGVGVASAVHVFVRRKLDTIAILRCLGADGRRLVVAYLLQTLVVALAGSVAGALLGVLAQGLLPTVLSGLLPVDVAFEPSGGAITRGVALGLAVATLGALLPLLQIRQVSPLLLLRRDFEVMPRPRDPWRMAVMAAAVAATVAVSVAQAPTRGQGLLFAAVVGAVLALLWAGALALSWAARRVARPSWPYVWRQGLRNLHRPANQTVSVVLALGFGAFLLGVLLLLQGNLLSELRVDSAATRPNLVLFDIQADQRDGIQQVVQRGGHATSGLVPVVPMRIASIKGVPAASLLTSRSPGAELRTGWAVRREYRSSYRDALGPSESVTAGAMWAPGSWKGRALDGPDPVPVSVEQDLARELGVELGDEIVWDVQGVTVRSTVTSLRQVLWARFEPNFFVLFPEGPLESAPQTFVTLTRVADVPSRAALQRELVQRFPNVTALDLAQVQQAVETTLGRVSVAVRFMALFSLAAGLIVLAGAVSSSRGQRIREATLLKALGATRAQVLRIGLVEYASLGLLAVVAGLAVAIPSAWGLMRYVFETTFRVDWAPLAALAAGLVAVAVAVGVTNGAQVFRRTSMDVLRTE